MREATTWCIVRGRWLAVHLAEGAGRRTEALRSAVGFRSVLCTGDLVTLDLDSLLRFDQVVIQLLECSMVCINLVTQMVDILDQKLLLRLHVAESGLVLRKIILHAFVNVMLVGDLTVLLLQQHFIVLDLLLQTPNVTLEFAETSLVTALFDGSATRQSVHSQGEELTKCSE